MVQYILYTIRSHHVSGMLNDAPVVCGGFGPRSDCLKYLKTNDSWEKVNYKFVALLDKRWSTKSTRTYAPDSDKALSLFVSENTQMDQLQGA